jgi:hypothetical protein
VCGRCHTQHTNQWVQLKQDKVPRGTAWGTSLSISYCKKYPQVRLHWQMRSVDPSAMIAWSRHWFALQSFPALIRGCGGSAETQNCTGMCLHALHFPVDAALIITCRLIMVLHAFSCGRISPISALYQRKLAVVWQTWLEADVSICRQSKGFTLNELS